MNLFDSLRERFLVRQFQRGNETAFLSLVRIYERRLLYFVRRFERDPDQALDVLQEVWLTAWKTRVSLRSPQAFRAWLYRIAHGKVVNTIRANSSRDRAERQRTESAPTTIAPTIAAIESAELVHFALSRISSDHREVLILRFIEGLSVPEIALVIDCPAGTVKSRLHYASQELISIVKEQQHGDQ